MRPGTPIALVLSRWPALAGTSSVPMLMLLLGPALLAATAPLTTAMAAGLAALDDESSG